MLHDRLGQRKYLNALERQRFVTAAMRLDDPAARAFCLTLYYTGCRLSEALQLTVSRVDRNERTLIFSTLKQRESKRYRAVPVPALLIDQLIGLSRRQSGDDAIWTLSRSTAWRTIKRCMARAEISGSRASPKGLRHGFAVACIRQGIPITTVQKWLGHRYLKTTSIYLDFDGEDERKLARRTWEKGD